MQSREQVIMTKIIFLKIYFQWKNVLKLYTNKNIQKLIFFRALNSKHENELFGLQSCSCFHSLDFPFFYPVIISINSEKKQVKCFKCYSEQGLFGTGQFGKDFTWEKVLIGFLEVCAASR